jgi:hypothetical protein
MPTFQEAMQVYKAQLQAGAVQTAYRGLMEYMMGLRTHLMKKYPEDVVTNLYQGYMDMTYFAFMPQSLKERGLKVAIVFLYDDFRFEVSLVGYNKQFQKKYWQLIRESGWDKYRLVKTLKGEDAIISHTLADDPDFADLDALTERIERGTLAFIADVEGFLSSHGN